MLTLKMFDNFLKLNIILKFCVHILKFHLLIIPRNEYYYKYCSSGHSRWYQFILS